jgi:integrase
LPPLGTFAYIRPCTSRRSPGCDEASSPGCAGPTGTNPATVSIARSRQVVAGSSVEVAVKTRTSRRCIDLDADTEKVLRAWRRRQQRDGHTVGTSDPIFTNATGQPVHPESIYQLFHRQVRRLDMPRICFHGLRHTHASLLVAAGTPIKVVSERLGHANPGFTMAAHQHVMPGMGAEAAHKFSQLLATSR